MKFWLYYHGCLSKATGGAHATTIAHTQLAAFRHTKLSDILFYKHCASWQAPEEAVKLTSICYRQESVYVIGINNTSKVNTDYQLS